MRGRPPMVPFVIIFALIGRLESHVISSVSGTASVHLKNQPDPSIINSDRSESNHYNPSENTIYKYSHPQVEEDEVDQDEYEDTRTDSQYSFSFNQNQTKGQASTNLIFKKLKIHSGSSKSKSPRNRRGESSTTAAPKLDYPRDDSGNILQKQGKKSSAHAEHTEPTQTSTAKTTYHIDYQTASVDGLRLETEDTEVSFENNGASIIVANAKVTIRLFGKNFTNHTEVRFSTEAKSRGAECDDKSSTRIFKISKIVNEVHASALLSEVYFPASHQDEYYYICLRENSVTMPWVHQGPDAWLTIKTYKKFLPFWVQLICICVLLMLSGLFAGLTLGLLALDKTDLQILANTGTENERNYAKTILPLRSRGNYLLCSLVLGNVLVNSTLTILLDDLTSGIIAVISSTAGIVIFGEIIPQAVCSRRGLAIGAKTVWVTKFLMVITFPLSYTISLILDKWLGEEIGLVYTRDKLKELVALTVPQNNLEVEEVNIISGALSMKERTVEHVMTPLDKVFMLHINEVLDFETFKEIRSKGYSRIPIYANERTNIVSLLFTKDLLFLDPKSPVHLNTLSDYFHNQPYFLLADTTLDVVFKEFKDSKKGRMVFVQRIQSPEDRDPYHETIGLVTFEDVIEELIQSEIAPEPPRTFRPPPTLAGNNMINYLTFCEAANAAVTGNGTKSDCSQEIVRFDIRHVAPNSNHA